MARIKRIWGEPSSFISNTLEFARKGLDAVMCDIKRLWQTRHIVRIFLSKAQIFSGYTVSPRMATLGIAVLVLFFTVAGFTRPERAHGFLGISGKDQEVRAEQDKVSQAEKAFSPIASADVFISALKVSDYDAVGGATPEPTLVSAQYTSLLGMTLPITTESSSNTRTQIVAYTVQTGDVLSTIAARFGVTTSTILWANDLRSADLIRPGDELLILPVNGVLHEVQGGDTVNSIALRYGVKAENIMDFNDIDPNANIVVGQELIVPDGKIQVRSRGGASRYTNLQQLDGYFARPTAGRISQGLHGYNAVDIAGGCWQPVYSAAPGSVRIASGAGRWNGGFGNFVSIYHPNNTATLYAHLVQVNISAGKEVALGELIGYTGSTGRSSGCHLHWEVRGAQNPLARY